jgi:hypothetical protein
VIGPIGNRLAAHGTPERLAYEEAIEALEEVILPACDAVGLNPVRADGLGRAGEIPDQVFRRLRDDDVVIADVSGANANVMYELGLRHTRHKLTVQIGEFSRLPFDLNVIRTVMFSRSQTGLIKARDELIQVLSAGLVGEYDPVTATRVWNEEREPDRVAPAADDADTEPIEAGSNDDDDPPGFVDLVAAAEDGQERVTAALNAIGELIQELGEVATASSAEMEESDARGRGMKGRLAVTVKYAGHLSEIAEQVESLVTEYVDAMEDVSAGNLAILTRLAMDPSQLAEAESYGLVTRALARTARESLAELSVMTDAMKEGGKMSRVLRAPTNKLVGALEAFARATAAIDQWDRKLQELGVAVPPPDWEPPENGPTGDVDGERPAT